MTTEHEDQRAATARNWLARHHEQYPDVDSPLASLVGGLLDWGDERYRVNAGLVMENAALRRRMHELEEGPKDG